MTALAQVNTYLTNHYEGMTPEQLILMLYNGALDRIENTRQGIKEKNIQKRGENLSKVIAIISELNASVDPEMNDESTRFLRGLYAAILAELPKVSMTNDVAILNRTESYINKLKQIWVTDVMGSNAGVSKNQTIKKQPLSPVPAYGGGNSGKGFGSISV